MKQKKIKLAFFSSTRGDLAILKPLLDQIKKNQHFDYLLFVHGTHLDKKYGNTIDEINNSKLKITAKSNTLSKEDSSSGLVNSLLLTQNFANKIFKKYKFDAVVLLGDRLERLPIVSNIIAYRKLLFHLHGGELTYGALDDQVRHIITKAAHLHFPICNQYKKNILNMAEENFRIFKSGSLAVENIYKFKKKNIIKNIVLLTYHPETMLNKFNWNKNFQIICSTLKKFDLEVIITAPGHEKGSKKNIENIIRYTKSNKNFKFIPSLGYKKYFEILNKTLFVIGNSSSGIIEVPYYKIPTIDIGSRQEGRFKHFSIINCKCNFKEINSAIKKALSKKYINKILKMKLYFGKGEASKKILKFIDKNMKDKKILINKKFSYG